MMILSLKQKINSFFVLLFAISTINFTLLIIAEDKTKVHFDWVLHTYEVMDNSDSLLMNLIDSETGQRGFLLTQKPEYLGPYLLGKENSLSKFSLLKSLTSDNATQQERLKSIKRLMEEKFFELNQTVELVEKGRMKDAIFIVTSDSGKTIMDNIRRVLNDFQAEEKKLQTQRESLYKNFRANTRLLFILESTLFAVFLIILSWITNKEIISPIQILTKAANNLRSGNIFNSVTITNKDEIGELAEAFNEAGSKIEKATQILEERHIKDIAEKNNALKASITDPLTGLNNRRYMEMEVDSLVAASHRYEHDLCIILIDIDYFKKINDNLGHAVGDLVLQALARLIKERTRNSDLVIRYGGEEFIIIVPYSMINEVEKFAEKLRLLVSKLIVPALNGTNITISLGVAKLLKDDLKIDNVILRADKALYEAKNGGRNQVRRG